MTDRQKNRQKELCYRFRTMRGYVGLALDKNQTVWCFFSFLMSHKKSSKVLVRRGFEVHKRIGVRAVPVDVWLTTDAESIQ